MGGGGGLNCGYIAKKAGIFKICVVVAGFFASGWFAYGVSNSDHMKDVCSVEINNQIVYEVQHCPAPWMVKMGTSLTSICFLSSLIELIVMLLVELNSSSLFNQVDFIAHVVAGVCLILSAILAIIYIAFAYEKVEERNTELCSKIPFAAEAKKCKNDYFDGFYIITFAGAAVLSILTGILYFITGTFIKQGR